MTARLYCHTYRKTAARRTAGTAIANDDSDFGGVGWRTTNRRIHAGRIIALVQSLNAILNVASVWIGWSGLSRRGERLPSRTRYAKSNASHDMVRCPMIMKVRKYAEKSCCPKAA